MTFTTENNDRIKGFYFWTQNMVSKGQRLEAGSSRTSPSKVNRLKMPRPKGRAAQQCCKKWKYKFKTGTILKGQIIIQNSGSL